MLDLAPSSTSASASPCRTAARGAVLAPGFARAALAAAALAVALSPFVAPAAAASAAPAGDPPPRVEDTVAVDLRTVPFFAVDAAGQPVFDLRADEIELRLDGRPIAIDTLDRQRLDGEVPAVKPGGGAVAVTAQPREVYLVVDQAFLSFPGLRETRRMAAAVAGAFQPGDRLLLVVNDAERGFQIVLGPVAGDAGGQRQLRQQLDKLQPRVDRLRTDPGLPPIIYAGPIGEQVHNAYEAGGSLMKAEYRSAAEQLADSLRLFALQLARTGTPKVVVLFSPGLDSQLYFEGEIGFVGVGSDGDALKAHVDLRRAGPIVQRFQPAFKALAASGANFFLMNPDASRVDGRDMLEQMRHEVGGVLLDRATPAKLVRELRAQTAAYYVAGFYADDATKLGSAVEVVVKRDGVRALAPRGVRTPRPWKTLDEDERKLTVLDIVHRGKFAPAAGLQPEVAVRPFTATVVGAGKAAAAGNGAATGKRLELVGQWPPELSGQRVEVYEVLLRTAQAGKPAELLLFRESARQPPAEPLDVQVTVGAEPQLWAVVLVEPTSGTTYMRRLLLNAPAPSTR